MGTEYPKDGSYYKERYVVPPNELVSRALATWTWVKKHLGTEIPQSSQKEIDLILVLAMGGGIMEESKRSLAARYSYRAWETGSTETNWISRVQIMSNPGSPFTCLNIGGGPASLEKDDGFIFTMNIHCTESQSGVTILVEKEFVDPKGLWVKLETFDTKNSERRIYKEITTTFRGSTLIDCPAFFKE